MTLAAISITGMLWFLIYAACLVGFVLALRWLAGKLGWTVPEPVWAIIGFICICILLLWLVGALGSGPILVR
jgi:hypothetical protein